MALGTRHDFTMHRGDDRQITARVVDQNGSAIDITAATFTWVLASKDAAVVDSDGTPAPKNTALVTKTLAGGVVIVNAANGDVRVDVGPGDTTGLKAPAEYYHELQMVLGETTTVLFGVIKLKRDLAAPGP